MSVDTRKVRGSVFAGGHQAFTRGLLRDANVKVRSVGSQFYNSNDFPLLYWAQEFFRYYANYQADPPKEITKGAIEEIWGKAKGKIRKNNEIVIAATPEWCDRSYMNRLDGGILHEMFHSMYTLRGTELDLDRIKAIFDRQYDPEIPYHKVADKIMRFNNVFEDAFIERKGIAEFKGALYKIQVVHEAVWDMERYARRYPEMGAPMLDARGRPWKDDEGNPLGTRKNPMMSMTPLDHLTCYIRDRVEHYLDRAPLGEYNPEVVKVAEALFGDIIQDSDHTESSYDVFELALRTMAVVYRLFEEAEEKNKTTPENSEGTPDQDEGGGGGGGDDEDVDDDGDDDNGDGDSDGSEGVGGSAGPGQDDNDDASDPYGEEKPESESGGEEGSESEGKKDAEQGEDPPETGADDERVGDDPEESEGDSEGSDDGGNEEGKESGGEEASEGSDDESGGEGESSGLEGLSKGVMDALSDPRAEFNAMGDIASALKQQWDSMVSVGAPAEVMPYSTEVDEEIIIEARNTVEETHAFNTIADKVRDDTLYIRPKMLSFFRGMRKSKIRHRQERGRRLSSRSIAEVVYRDKPRPFMDKVVTDRKDSVVSLMMDESSSMYPILEEATKVMTTLALTIGGLKIPFEAVGFTTGTQNALAAHLVDNPDLDTEDYIEDVRQRFTRVQGVTFRVFRGYDEPFNMTSYKKMLQTSAYGLTPLPDAIKYAADRIRGRKEDQKIIFIVTDGNPCYQGMKWSTEDYLNIMKTQIQSLRREGIEVMLIGIGPEGYFVEKYPNSVWIQPSELFAPAFANFIFDQMQRIMVGA